jgi:hypothetical protein
VRIVTADQLLVSTPDALPMEIALIALLLFKLQVYLTSLRHYYHRPITLSTFQLSHQSTLHHMVLINILRLPIKKFFVHKIGTLHTHSTASHSLSYLEFTCNSFFQLLSVSPSLFSPQSHASRVMGPIYGNIVAIINLQVQLWNSPQRNRGDLHYQLHLDSINRTSMATTAAHAIRYCNTSSTWNACNWCDLVIFSCITYKIYCSNVSFMIFLHSSPLLSVLFPFKPFYPFLPFPI